MNFSILRILFSDFFTANITPERNCALYLIKSLDFESKEMYELEIQLDSLQGLVNPMRSSAIIKITVVDVNDNLPEFIFPRNKRSFENGTYFGALSKDASVNSVVLQVKVSFFNFFEKLCIIENKFVY